MLRKGQEGHVRAERDVLKSASLVHSPRGAEWIVRLYYSFQDRDHLYLVSHQIYFPKVAVEGLISTSFPNIYQVLEYMGGGDLLNLLIERDVFEEDFTRFYIAEVIYQLPRVPYMISDWFFVKMILAIESCHRYGFIHRDIKPDVGPFNKKSTKPDLTMTLGRTFSLTPKATLNSAISD